MKNLIELHELRAQEKAIKARINVISPAAEEEALSLAPNGGQFTHEGLTFQLQLTDVTEEMAGLIDSFRKTHPNWQPDEVKKVVKCL